MKRLFGIWFAALLFAAPPLAAAVTQEQLKEQSARATAEKFPNAESVLLYDWQSTVYQADGTDVETDDFYQKILTETGRRNLREISFHFNATYEKFEIPLLEVVKPDGKVVKVDVASHGKIAIESSQMGANIYDPANKVLAVAIPGLEIGDIVHIVTRETTLKPRIPGVWSSIYGLQSDTPILHYEVRIDAPESLPLRAIRIKNEVKGSIHSFEEKKAGRILYTWTAENVPQVIPEPDMPPVYLCVQRLLVSTAKSWPEISQWYYRLCRPRLDAVTPEIRAKVAELTKDAETPDAKIMALFQFVSQQIRYMGITAESEAPGYEPHDVSLTFSRRYGVCRDKAALLAAMLEIAGFKAFPVLFMAGYPKDDEVPNNYFNHAITAVEDRPGHCLLMDPTYETTTELFPSTLANMSYLIAKPEGDVLRRSELVPAEKNLLKIKTLAAVTPEGTLTGRSVIDFLGVNDQIYRDMLSRWPLDFRRQFFASRLKQAVAGAELEELKISPENVRDMSRPLTVELTFRAEGFLPEKGEAYLLELPCFGTEFGAVNFVLDSVGLKTRLFPLQIFSACGVLEEYTLSLPPSCKIVSLPQEVAIKAPGILNFRRSFRVDGAVLKGENYFSVDTIELRPEEYAELKRALAKADAAERELPIVRPDFAAAAQRAAAAAFPAADSIILASSIEVKLQDAANWSRTDHTTLKILNYAGVKECSELKIAFTPVWETVEIEAKVTLPDGTVRTLSSRENNTMDASWTAAAPRYPTGKLIVASLPGVVPGSTIETTIRRSCRNRPFFHLAVGFAGDSPIIAKRFVVDAPQSLPLHRSPTPEGVTFAESREKERVRYEWRTENVPQLPTEPSRPPLWMYAPTVTVSSGDYADFGRKLAEALTAKTLDAPESAALARKLAPESMAADARVHAIRTWVARNIRPAGPSLNVLPWSAFTPADVTLKSGYGDSADRAILLYAMLKAAGIDCRFLAGSELGYAAAATRPLLRSPQNIFTKVLVYLPAFDSYLNDTGEYATLGATASEETIGLALDTGKLTVIRPRRKSESALEYSYRIRLCADGSARIEATRGYYGLDDQTMRQHFAEMTPAERGQYFESLAAGISQSAVFQGEPVTAFDRYPGQLHFTLDVPDFAAVSGDYLQFILPDFAALANLVKTAESSRQTPLWRNRPAKVKLKYRIELPPNFTPVAAGPERFEFGKPGTVVFSRSMEEESGILTLEYALTLPVEEVSPAGYTTLVELQKELAKLSTSRIILKRSNL